MTKIVHISVYPNAAEVLEPRSDHGQVTVTPIDNHLIFFVFHNDFQNKKWSFILSHKTTFNYKLIATKVNIGYALGTASLRNACMKGFLCKDQAKYVEDLSHLNPFEILRSRQGAGSIEYFGGNTYLV